MCSPLLIITWNCRQPNYMILLVTRLAETPITLADRKWLDQGSARFQTSASKYVRTALFWAVTHRVVVITYRHFGTFYWSHLERSTRISVGLEPVLWRNQTIIGSIWEFCVYGTVHRNSTSVSVQQDATVHSSFYLRTALHVSGGFFTHHQEHK